MVEGDVPIEPATPSEDSEQTRNIHIDHRVACPECKVPVTVWLQKTRDGASSRLLLTCETCWAGFQVLAKSVRQVKFSPFYER